MSPPPTATSMPQARLRIAQVAPLYESVPPPSYGGTERVVSWLTEALVAAGHDVTLFASGDSVTSARLIPCCPKALRLHGAPEQATAYQTILLEEVVRRAHEFDVIHNHLDCCGLSLTRRCSTPVLTTLHGRLDLPHLPAVMAEFRGAPLISISQAQQRPLPEGRFIGTVHHGLPRDLFRPAGEPRGYLAFVGRISPDKRVDRAIAIATAIGMPLVVAAKVDAQDRAYFDREISPLLDAPGIDFLGEVGDAEKNELLGAANALLFPIDWPEPFGLVMIEAMACGTPVIAFGHGAVPEVIDDGVTGFVCNRVEEAIDATRRAFDLDRSRIRETFERRFTADRMAADYLEHYWQQTQRLAAVS